VIGAPRDIDVGVHAETFLIVREALSNAIRHAGAKSVIVNLEYERQSLRLTVRDDGAGIDEAIVREGGRPGHWGLQGMRERAEKLRATFSVRRRVEGGTEVELSIPASLAYVAR
jgi:signal transduction histidine kinase